MPRGAFQSQREFGEAVWRFDEHAAERARGFKFHPARVVEDRPDGSLIVRFRAAGWTEMTFHLCQRARALIVKQQRRS